MKRKLLAVIAIAIPGTLAACGGGNSGGGNPTSAGTTATCPRVLKQVVVVPRCRLAASLLRKSN